MEQKQTRKKKQNPNNDNDFVVNEGFDIVKPILKKKPNIKVNVKTPIQKILDLYTLNKCIYNSMTITFNNGKKQISPPTEWQKNKISQYDATKNGLFIQTGIISDMFVIDIDDMTIKEAKQLYDLCIDHCKMTIKTRKGYHFYYKYDPSFSINSTFRKYGFDIRSNNGMIICPPSYYIDIFNNRYEYIFIKNEGIIQVSHDIKTYMINIINIPLTTIKNMKDKDNTKKKEKHKLPELDPFINILEDDIIIKLLDNLSIERVYDFEKWIKVGLCLYNSNYSWTFWDHFSKRFDRYYYEDNEKYYATLYNNYKSPKSYLTVSTLWYWLKKDSPDMFNQLQKEQMIHKYDNIPKVDLNKFEIFDQVYLNKLFQEDINTLGIRNYENMITSTNSFKYFEKYHFYLKNKNKFIYYNMIDNAYVYYNDLNMYNSIQYRSGKETIYFKVLYLNCVHIRIYQNFEFIPIENHVSYNYNLFDGFRLEKLNSRPPTDKHTLFLQHIMFLCKEEYIYNYVINWVSHIIQKPHSKTGMVIMFYSAMEGVGKNLLGLILGAIFGKYYTEITNKEIYAEFNEIFKNKLLIIANEITGKAKTEADTLKDMITRNTININEKHVSAYTLNDYCNYIFTSNHELCLNLTHNDRRYFLVECPNVKKDSKYYESIINLINDKDALYDLYMFFKLRDISSFNPRKVIITEYKERCILFNMPAYVKFLYDNLESYTDDNIYSIDTLYKACLEYSRKNFMTIMTKFKFNEDFFKLFGDYFTRTNAKRGYKFTNLDLDKIDIIVKEKLIQQPK